MLSYISFLIYNVLYSSFLLQTASLSVGKRLKADDLTSWPDSVISIPDKTLTTSGRLTIDPSWSNYPWSRHAQVKKTQPIMAIPHGQPYWIYCIRTTRLHSKETWPSVEYARLERNWDLDGSDHGWLDHGTHSPIYTAQLGGGNKGEVPTCNSPPFRLSLDL